MRLTLPMVAVVLAVLALQDAQVEKVVVAGVERSYTVYPPSKPEAGKPPLVFGFHGHGGSMKSAARSFRMHEEMPEAVVVYMQGLPTVTPNDPEGRRNGWQGRADTNGDRDLKFFDAVLASLTSRYGVDTSRVFALGHSNGGRFTYLLWAERGEVFRAFGPSGSGSVGLELVPRPFFHVAGEKDPIVAFSKQRQSVVSQLERQGCPSDPAGKRGFAWYYKGVGGNDAVTYFHPGGHEYPKEVPPLLAKFFRSL